MNQPKAPEKLRRLIVVCGDQLDIESAAFDGFDSAADAVLMTEAREEATYVPQHKRRLILFFSARVNGTVKRFIRHPQLTGVIAWSAAHLLANGDSRSLALFGTIGVWAIVEIVLINRREGPQGELPTLSVRHDVIAVAIGGIVFALLAFFHDSLFGVAVLV